jgi:hypothetical protein
LINSSGEHATAATDSGIPWTFEAAAIAAIKECETFIVATNRNDCAFSKPRWLFKSLCRTANIIQYMIEFNKRGSPVGYFHFPCAHLPKLWHAFVSEQLNLRLKFLLRK